MKKNLKSIFIIGAIGLTTVSGQQVLAADNQSDISSSSLSASSTSSTVQTSNSVATSSSSNQIPSNESTNQATSNQASTDKNSATSQSSTLLKANDIIRLIQLIQPIGC